MIMHVLDRPIWSSLNSGWAEYAQGDARGLRLDPDYGPFAAPADLGEGCPSLAELIAPGSEAWLVERDPVFIGPGLTILRTASLDQMVAEAISPAKREFDAIPLNESDAPEMLALATATRPGPYKVRTNRLGNFVGLRDRGVLVAMAGERMRMDGFTEVSGVCTDPAYRGRGYAGALIRIVAGRMLARGETPFLHSYPDNEAAIALYKSIGFTLRTSIGMTVVTRA